MQITDYLKQNKLSQYALAKKLGVPPSYVWRYCHGHNKPSPCMILKIDKATGGKVTFRDWYEDEVEQ